MFNIIMYLYLFNYVGTYTYSNYVPILIQTMIIFNIIIVNGYED